MSDAAGQLTDGVHLLRLPKLRFEVALARELSPRPVAVVAHMCPIYAVLAAPLVRPLRIPLALWFTHWRDTRRLRLAARLCSVVCSVNRQTFPFDTPKLVPIGHGIDMEAFTCTARPDRTGLRALVLGRTSAAKGVDHVFRAAALARERGVDVEVDAYGPSLSQQERANRTRLEQLAAQLGGARVHDAVQRSEVPRLLAEADCLVNNMREGATDKVVYEAAASCVPVLASNSSFDDLLHGLDLDFPREDEEALAGRFARLAAMPHDERTRVGHLLRDRATAGHSVETWADRLLAAVE